jgi:predicted MarR family transcription regulator
MRTECVQDSPDNFETFVVVQRVLRRHIIRHNDRDDDIAVVLALERAHNPSHALHHLHFAVAW